MKCVRRTENGIELHEQILTAQTELGDRLGRIDTLVALASIDLATADLDSAIAVDPKHAQRRVR